MAAERDEVYEIPWEFTSPAAKMLEQHKVQNGIVKEQASKQQSAPTCGVTAHKLRHEKQQSTPRSSNSPIWTYRGPETDDRPQTEYDAPWDFKKKAQLRAQSQIYDPVCENEEVLPSVAEKVRLFSRVNGEKETNRSNKSMSVCLPSNNIPRSPTLTSSDLSSSSNGTVTGVGRNRDKVSPRRPLIETAFCSKPPHKSLLDSKQERKNRIIQQVVSGLDENISKVRKPGRITSSSKFRSKTTDSSPSPSPRSAEKNDAKAKVKIVDKRTKKCQNDKNVQQPCSSNDKFEEKLANGELQYDVPWEFCERSKLVNKLIQKEGGAKADVAKLDRKELSLNFGCSGLNPSSETFDPDVPLEQQQWYHGNISRAEAEQRLVRAKEGSYLVRICESNKDEYALSLKSARGYMHMKIQMGDKKQWVLGYFSQPFEHIPTMIRYYSINKLPIKGAEHMCLLYPVKEHYL